MLSQMLLIFIFPLSFCSVFSLNSVQISNLPGLCNYVRVYMWMKTCCYGRMAVSKITISQSRMAFMLITERDAICHKFDLLILLPACNQPGVLGPIIENIKKENCTNTLSVCYIVSSQNQ